MNEKFGSESVLLHSESANLRYLRAQLQKPFPQIDDLQFEDQGFIVEGGYVIGLQLQDMGLTTLPDNLNNFKKLKHLHLSQNNFKSLDLTFIHGCTSLEILELDQCRIRNLDLIPLRDTRRLAILKLNHNECKTIDLAPLRHCQKLEFLNLDNNQLSAIDLTPLRECTKIGHLDLANNQLQRVNLSFLNNITSLRTLGVAGNPLTELDITPLLSQSHFRDLNIDLEIPLHLSSIHRDYSLDHRWFTSEFLPHVNWVLQEENLPYEALYKIYRNIVQNFRHEEYWPDYRDRRLKIPPENSYEVRFFECLVERYMEIKDRPRSEYSAEEQRERRDKILNQVQDQFLRSDALVSVLKDFFEPYQEPVVSVTLIEDVPQNPASILILHYWPFHSPSQVRLVQTITWVNIVVDDSDKCYHVHFGFNRGVQQAGQKYHPILPPKEFPPDVFTTTEVMYEISSLTTSKISELLERSREWLRESFYPKFDPDWPKDIYRRGGAKPIF